MGNGSSTDGGTYLSILDRLKELKGRFHTAATADAGADGNSTPQHAGGETHSPGNTRGWTGRYCDLCFEQDRIETGTHSDGPPTGTGPSTNRAVEDNCSLGSPIQPGESFVTYPFDPAMEGVDLCYACSVNAPDSVAALRKERAGKLAALNPLALLANPGAARAPALVATRSFRSRTVAVDGDASSEACMLAASQYQSIKSLSPLFHNGANIWRWDVFCSQHLWC